MKDTELIVELRKRAKAERGKAHRAQERADKAELPEDLPAKLANGDRGDCE